MTNYKFIVSYSGKSYNGWQKQSNTDKTIQGKIEKLLSRMYDMQIEINGAGRTDAGVHARGQVFNARLSYDGDTIKLRDEINSYLPKDIVIKSVEKADGRFHARLHAKSKCYVYSIEMGNTPDVFTRDYVYELGHALDVDAMREAAKILIGEHDFIGFSSLKNSKKSTVRNIYSIDIDVCDTLMKISYIGDGFLYNMVRILTGTLIAVGEEKMSIKDIEKILRTGDRTLAAGKVPPEGLMLEWVRYID